MQRCRLSLRREQRVIKLQPGRHSKRLAVWDALPQHTRQHVLSSRYLLPTLRAGFTPATLLERSQVNALMGAALGLPCASSELSASSALLALVANCIEAERAASSSRAARPASPTTRDHTGCRPYTVKLRQGTRGGGYGRDEEAPASDAGHSMHAAP